MMRNGPLTGLLITAYRPSALRRLGLAGAHLRHRLTHVEIVGHAGDAAEAPGHDLTYQAVHGTLTPPAMPTVPVADMLGAERAVTATLLGIAECATKLPHSPVPPCGTG